jgi:hypothetical protein
MRKPRPNRQSPNPIAVSVARLLAGTKQALLTFAVFDWGPDEHGSLALLGWAANSLESSAHAFSHGLPNAIRKTYLFNPRVYT